MRVVAVTAAALLSAIAAGEALAATDVRGAAPACAHAHAGRRCSTTPRPVSHPYFAERFDGAFTTRLFSYEPEKSLTFVPGLTRLAARLTACAVNVPGTCVDGTNVASSSAYGQDVGVDAVSSPHNDVPHAGRVAGSGIGCCDADGAHADTWYRLRFRTPSDYKPTPGTQNAVFEFHVDDKTAQDASAHGSAVSSTMLLIESDPPRGFTQGSACPGSPMMCTVAGVAPRLLLQVAGGNTTDARATSVKWFPMTRGSFRVGHWYDVVFHIVWDANPQIGRVQWWVDGKKILDVHAATQYRRTDGTLSYGENISVSNYRLWAKWASSLDIDQLVVGPTRQSLFQR